MVRETKLVEPSTVTVNVVASAESKSVSTVPSPTEEPIFETLGRRLFAFQRSSERIFRELNESGTMEIARMSVGKGLKSFLGDLKKLSGSPKATVEEAAALLKTADSGIKSTDELMKRLTVTKNAQGALLLDGLHLGRVHKLLREGDLKELIRLSKANVPTTAADVAAFRRLVGDTPESGLKNVADLATATKRERPHLNATLDDLDKISDTARVDLKKVESNLYRRFKEGSVIALTIGTVTVATNWIVNATKARKGCFMVTTIDGKTTSCKVASFTCSADSDKTAANACKGGPPLDCHNTTLVLIHLASLPDGDPDKIALATAVGVEPSRLSSQLANVVDNHYSAATAAVAKMGANVFNAVSVCGARHEAIEGGIVPPCRMCDPTADPVSTSFIDPALYGDNITFQCVTNPSLLDTIADIVVSTGHDVWTGVSNVLSWSLKQMGIVAAAIVIVLILVSLLVRVFKRTRPEHGSLDDDDDDDDNSSGSPFPKHRFS